MPNKSAETTPDHAREDAGPDFVQSLARGLLVIRAFSEKTPSMTLSEVARATGLTRAAARRFLYTLEVLGYVRSNGRQFSLLPKVLDLGYSYLSAFPVWDIAESHMEKLVHEVHESSSISVLDGSEIVYVARVPTTRIFSTHLSVGSRLPAYPSAMGRVLLAHLSPSDLDAYLAATRLEPLTQRTITDPDRLRSVLGTIRQQGWALVDQELEDGIRTLAAPLRKSPGGPVIASINLSSHASRVKMTTLREAFLPRLLETAAAITQDMGRRSGLPDGVAFFPNRRGAPNQASGVGR